MAASNIPTQFREASMAGNLDLRELEDLIRKEEVHTVLTVFPDIQGRLMGKRVVGHYFLDHVAAEGLQACLYLVGVYSDGRRREAAHPSRDHGG
jgi:hypothetical protein